ncbi:MAG: DUF4230 domain-containing protein [Muribaculaceae bacterium]|nr:DUF4230 domain-containing protein [Muribaculaceae bacterium]
MKRILYIITLSLLVSLMAGCSRQKDDATALPDFYEQVTSAQKMVLARMAVTKMAKTERTDWYKVGKRVAVYSYDTYLRAYIDLGRLSPADVVVDEASRTVRLTLPPVMVEPEGRDLQMRRVYENVGLLRSDIDARERAEIKERANASLMKELRENPAFTDELRSTAERKASAYFKTLFEAQGYTVTIDFHSPYNRHDIQQ